MLHHCLDGAVRLTLSQTPSITFANVVNYNIERSADILNVRNGSWTTQMAAVANWYNISVRPWQDKSTKTADSSFWINICVDSELNKPSGE